MNLENPYAAPQTTELRMPTALPVAELAGRRDFPELDTVSLRQLAAHSQAIDHMSLMWVVLILFPGVALVVMNSWSWFLFALVAGVRAWTGNLRTPGYGKLNRNLDLIVFVGSLGFLAFAFFQVFIASEEVFAFVSLGVLVLLLAIFSGFSTWAHFAAQVLYGNYPHQKLLDEVSYRKRHHIE